MRASPVLPAALGLLAGCGGASGPPNVLLVTLDTTRADALGSYGNAEAHTPALDGLASAGVRFSRAYTVTPLTIPAHSSIFTGLYPPRHGVRDNGDFFLGEDATTLAERLREAGYATMASVGAEVTSHHWGFAQGFDAFYDEMGRHDGMANRWRVERRGDAVVDDALGWLDQHLGKEKPVFAWVHLFDAHHPYEAPEPFASDNTGRPYQAEVSYADSQVARLLAKLVERGVDDDTWVIVTGDHGEGLGSHGETMHGVLLYDATTHIPMLARPPGGGEGRVVDTPVSLVDLAPTVLSLAGAPPFQVVDGVDLAGVLRGASGDAGRAVYAESLYAWHHYGWAPQKALVVQDHKLIDSTTPELYARDDVNEARDLAKTDAAGLAQLRERLLALGATLEDVGTADRAELDPQRLAQLEALGYLTGTAGDTEAEGLPDPVRNLPVLALVERARKALQSGDLADARLRIEEAVAADPHLREPKVMLAQLLWRQGDVDEAARIAEESLAEHPQSQLKAMLASMRLQQKRPEEATALYADALAMDPYLANAWGAYLHLLFATGDMERFSAELARARTLVPDTPIVVGMDGVARSALGDHGNALPRLEEAIARDPNQPFVYWARGRSLRADGRLEAAEASFEEEIRLFPPAVSARRDLVAMYAEQKRYDEQLAQLQAIRTSEPPTPMTLHSIAQALFNLQRYAEASTEVDACVALAPGYPGCAMLQANVLKKLGRDADAQVAYARALRLADQAPPTP